MANKKSDIPKITIEGTAEKEKGVCTIQVPRTTPGELGDTMETLFKQAAKFKPQSAGGTLTCEIDGVTVGNFKLNVPKTSTERIGAVVQAALEQLAAAGITVSTIRGTLTCF